jgi:hypothetical protein
MLCFAKAFSARRRRDEILILLLFNQQINDAAANQFRPQANAATYWRTSAIKPQLQHHQYSAPTV